MGLFENSEYFQASANSAPPEMDFLKMDLEKQEQIPLRCASSTVLNPTPAENEQVELEQNVETLSKNQINEFKKASKRCFDTENIHLRVFITAMNFFVLFFIGLFAIKTHKFLPRDTTTNLSNVTDINLIVALLVVNFVVHVGILLFTWLSGLKYLKGILIFHCICIALMIWGIWILWNAMPNECYELFSCDLFMLLSSLYGFVDACSLVLIGVLIWIKAKTERIEKLDMRDDENNEPPIQLNQEIANQV
jgi:hypothetical protein